VVLRYWLRNVKFFNFMVLLYIQKCATKLGYKATSPQYKGTTNKAKNHELVSMNSDPSIQKILVAKNLHLNWVYNCVGEVETQSLHRLTQVYHLQVRFSPSLTHLQRHTMANSYKSPSVFAFVLVFRSTSPNKEVPLRHIFPHLIRLLLSMAHMLSLNIPGSQSTKE
jgi:hypothetical protein